MRLLKALEEPEVVMCSPVTVYPGVVCWICCLRDVTDKGLIDGAVNKYLEVCRLQLLRLWTRQEKRQ